jgi:hypothetical protein
LLPPVVVAAIPPMIHPTSSCSWGWGRVVCRPSCGAGAGVVGRGIRRAHRGRWGDVASSTRTTLRASARRGGGRVLVFAVSRLPSPSLPGMVHTRKPPYEQLLVGVVAGGVSSLGAGVLVVVPPLSLT